MHAVSFENPFDLSICAPFFGFRRCMQTAIDELLDRKQLEAIFDKTKAIYTMDKSMIRGVD